MRAGVDVSASLRELVQDNHVSIQAHLPQVEVWDLKRAEVVALESQQAEFARRRHGCVLQWAPVGPGGLQWSVPTHDIIHNACLFCTVWLTET